MFWDVIPSYLPGRIEENHESLNKDKFPLVPDSNL